MLFGIVPEAHIICSAAKACDAVSSPRTAGALHAVAISSGYAFYSIVQSSLLHMYVKCGRLNHARILFDKAPQPDVVTCTALISGYARQGLMDEAKNLFHHMEYLRLKPNHVTWNSMISGFNQSGFYRESVLIFKEMHSSGACPDRCSVSSSLPAVGELELSTMGAQIHGAVIKQGFGSDKCVVSSLINMYGKCSLPSEMSGVFHEMKENDVACCNAFVTGLSRNGLVDEAMDAFKKHKSRGIKLNVLSWTSVVACCSQNGRDVVALDLFREMQDEGMTPNSITIASLLPACGNIAALAHGKAVHCFSLRRGVSNDVYVGSALVSMYAKCGKIQAARIFFNRMPARNLVSWNSMMNGYAMFGKAKVTLEVFHLMQRSGTKPDSISFTCVLSACSHGGMLEEGWRIFNSMSQEHGIDVRIEHYACMVMLLGRAGKLAEAKSLIGEIPFKPDACVWGALLSSCRVHNDIRFAEIAAKKLFELEPKNPGNYVILSNIYSSKGMWIEVDRLRSQMVNVGLRKNPGCSWIEIKNVIHVLMAGDKSHPQMPEIVDELQRLGFEMRKRGYIPVSEFVLQDVEEQDKELILCGHSEKLAVVLGLLKTIPGCPIRVIKNLRICGDCHTVIKFISVCERREIFVRDANRFHHFKDGVCSCEDYW